MVVVERPVKTEVVTVSDFFIKAAEILEVNGWNQGELESEDGRICALEAINRSAYFFQIPFPSESLYYVILGPIWEWNDTAGRKKEEVIALFHRLAEEF